MIRVRSAVAILTIAAFACGGVNAKSALDTGMEISNKAWKYACWYENLKMLHPGGTGSKGFGNCNNQLDINIKNFEQYKAKGYPDQSIQNAFGNAIKTHIVNFSPEFKSTCSKYADDVNMAPPADESEVLQDSGDYPFKGFAHCMIHELRTKYGQEAIDAVMAQKVKGTGQDFRKVMLERENEYRAIHGVKPFEIDAQMNKDAQTWADDLAKRCYDGKDPHDHVGTKAKKQGENIHRGGGTQFLTYPEDAGYSATNGWYSEIDRYDFSTHESKTGQAVGHFTQTVWKDSERVGYGYAYNAKCAKWKIFTVARYSPPGNVQMQYPDGRIEKQHSKNVFPPQH